jgi:hypothetical protein
MSRQLHEHRLASARRRIVNARAPTWLTVAVSCLGLTMVLVMVTARLTLLHDGYDARAIAKTNAYERLYTEVLPAPSTQALIRESLAASPVDPTFVTANLRLFLPPSVLQQSVDEAIAEFVAYLLGANDSLDLSDAVQPMARHATSVVQDLLPGAVAATPRLTTSSLAEFRSAFRRYVSDLQSGGLPAVLPVIPLRGDIASKLTEVLTSGLTPDTRPELQAAIDALIRSGDVTDALAIVARAYVQQDPAIPTEVARRITSGVTTLQHPLTRFQHDPSVRALRATHSVLPLGLWSLGALGGLLLLIALALALRTPQPTAKRLRVIGAHLVIAGVVAVGMGYLLARQLPDPLRDVTTSGKLSPAATGIVRDVDHRLRAGVGSTFVHMAGIVVVVGVATLFTAAVTRRARSDARTHRRPTLAIGLLVTLLVGAAIATTTPPTSATQATCNGYAALCALPYNSVTYLASHNAMAASDAGFVNADQDPDMVGQLDQGVRALLVDLHYWTTPTEVQSVLNGLPSKSRTALAPLLTAVSPRPGLWLCHVACQLGATPAVEGLQQVKEWLHGHQDAVLTLIIEDHVSESDVESVLQRSGLRHYVLTPPGGETPWPTLREMVTSGHRLVVFTEFAHPTVSWLRNYHDVGAETPFEVSSPADLGCAPGRGPPTAPLFLMNNWVSSPAPSRGLAARVNRPQAILSRAERCQRARGMRPTYVAVDFAQIADPLAAVDQLNGTPP